MILHRVEKEKKEYLVYSRILLYPRQTTKTSYTRPAHLT
jgi:hypothetical protein